MKGPDHTKLGNIFNFLKLLAYIPKNVGVIISTVAFNLSVSDRFFEKSRWSKSHKIKNNYVHVDLKSKQSVFKDRGI